MRSAVTRLLEAPVDIAALAAFRILFGTMMALGMARFLAKGWVRELYVAPAFHFTYPGFEWVRPLPDFWMHAHFVLLAVLAAGIALGCCYRVCVVLFFLGFTYVELLDQSNYLNHYYFISLLSGLMIFLPAHRAWSVDGWRNPELRAATVPAWTLNLLRFQVGVVYFFAGLAKVNADWLLHAQPLRLWLAARSDLPIIGPWLNEMWVAHAASWGGAIFDLTIPFLLLHRRTRAPAYVAVMVFHVTTWLLFNIGMFPWIMMVAALVMFPAGWPRSFAGRVTGRDPTRGEAGHQTANAGVVPSELAGRSWGETPRIAGATPAPLPRWGIALLAAYIVLQLALPLRTYLMSQPPAWTGRGFNLAWQVMIVEKTGFVEFHAVDPASGQRRRIATRDYLTPRQEMMMAQDPQLIRAFARHLSSDLRRRGEPDVQIKVNAYASLNGRPSQPMINPAIDLAGPVPADWIVPLAR